MNDTRSKKEKNQHIQVFARVRPINNAEKTGKSLSVVEVVSNKEVVVRERPQDKLSKKFIFDKVFGPLSKQIDVYNAVVYPLLEEVLAGYNCTVFAYGQTGTGKTFTMEGVSNDPTLHWQSDTSAGIIPRALSHLFDELRMLEAQEYTVRVSFLELYNEELFDLLSPNDDASKIRLYEDASRKGAVIIHGLEEVTVHNKSEVYKILEKGSEKRQTAATLMNAHSSRSHTVFSITVHIKENTVEGEELLKTGKLNLVDLAGSENVGRSGAIDRRAREAGNINQSLLTLGRVITALVERAPHIPYRESKLTRLLQESLGGRTKTSIIATVSPASVNLEETLSTLDYAYRAKNITNRPEINQKLSKKALLKEYTEEIERLRRDLSATRERNGVYLAHENYNEMQALIEIQGREIEEKINHIKALEETMQTKEKIFNDLQLIHRAQTNELNATKNVLHNTTNVLKSTKTRLVVTERDLVEHKHLVEKHASTEQVLFSQAQTLLKVADTATTDTHKLHDKIVRTTKVEEENENLREQFRSNISKRFQDIEKDLSIYTQELVQFCISMKNNVDVQTAAQSRNIDSTIHHISKDVHNQEVLTTNKLSVDVNSSYEWYKKWLDNEIQNSSRMTEHESALLNNISEKLAPRIQNLVQNGIVESLQTLNVHVCRRLEQLSAYTVEQINFACNQLLANRDQIHKDVEDIKENVQTFLQSQNEIVHKRQQFAKMFDDMYHQFNDLYKCEEQNATALLSSTNHVTDICNIINDNATTNYNNNAEKERSMQHDIQKTIDHLKQDVRSGLEKNWTVAEQAASQGNMLIAELQTDLSNTCNGLAKYNESVDQNTTELNQKIESDKETLLLSVENLRKIHTDASVNHIESMEQERNRIINASVEIGHKCTNQSVEATDWTNRITAQLRTTEHQVDKFLTEDIRRNVPTGSTPARKEFQYPRQLVTTSPHERILQRFRETKKLVEECMVSDEEETIISDYTVCHQENVSPPTLPEISIISQLGDDTLCGTSTPNGNTATKQTNCESTLYHYDSNCMIKAASTSDLSIISRPSLDISAQSEPETDTKNNNKENGDDEFVKPDNAGVKRLSKLRCPNRRVLGAHN